MGHKHRRQIAKELKEEMGGTNSHKSEAEKVQGEASHYAYLGKFILLVKFQRGNLVPSKRMRSHTTA